MGLLSDIFMGDVNQCFSIDQNRTALQLQAMKQAEASMKLSDAVQEIARLKQQNGELRLAVTTLTRFLIERRIVNRAEWEAFVREMDTENGL